jgi:AraC-like DNA-binding protein
MIMLYLEQKPSPPLADCIRSFWYACAPNLPHERERVLPTGALQIVINLAADRLTDCGIGEEAPCREMPGAVIVGARSHYEVIHMRDLAEIMGIVFFPGGFAPWLRYRADDFFQRSVSLDAFWSTRQLVDRLREQLTPALKLNTLDRLLTEQLRGRSVERKPIVKAALADLRHNTVRGTARHLEISERRLHQLISEDAGLSPKLWGRIHRFQMAVKALHRGADTHWKQLALDCGYYDQSHFTNDFHAFSGIDPTTYSAARGRWRNHVIIA